MNCPQVEAMCRPIQNMGGIGTEGNDDVKFDKGQYNVTSTSEADEVEWNAVSLHSNSRHLSNEGLYICELTETDKKKVYANVE